MSKAHVLTIDEIKGVIEMRKYLIEISVSEKFNKVLNDEIVIWEKRIKQIETYLANKQAL